MVKISKHWQEHIEAWQSSGLTQTEYCRQQDLNSRTFAARLSDYRKGGSGSVPKLIPVQVEKSETVEVLALHWGSGYRLELPCSMPAAWLVELVRGLV
jgi:hypothetical protein